MSNLSPVAWPARRRLSRPVAALLGLCALLLCGGLTAGDAAWKLAPTIDHGEFPDYRPALDKHFQIDGDLITAQLAVGADFFKPMQSKSVFAGTGPLWITNTAWPANAADFEFTCEYKWFQAEPMVKYGDFPDLHLGFRLNEQGVGYILTWGMLGQIRIFRTGAAAGEPAVLVGNGVLKGIKDKWLKLKIRVVGPSIKIKLWPADKAEPEYWSAEACDDWRDEPGVTWRQGAVAVGFYGRKHFDTCVYSYRNCALRVLSADEAKAEAAFDLKTAPAHIGFANCSDTQLATVPEVTAVPLAQTVAWVRDANVKLEAAENGALRLTSTDAQPGFVWLRANPKVKTWSARMQATGTARPLFAIKDVVGDKTQMGFLDPVWRAGVVGLFWQSAKHSSGLARFEFKPETDYDFLMNQGHWQKWQITEKNATDRRAAFASKIVAGKGERWIGLGVAGQGTVILRGVSGQLP